jgi:hypothetical protein
MPEIKKQAKPRQEGVSKMTHRAHVAANVIS